MLHRNWTIANDPPHHTAGPFTEARHPLIVTTSHAGTMIDTGGSWRPAIALSRSDEMPVTAPGSDRCPVAPYATGAVLR